MKNTLHNKTIVISGGTKGLGKALVKECVRLGANVVIGGRDEGAGLDLTKWAKGMQGKVHFVNSDLRKVSNCKKLFDEAIHYFNQVDGFVNYAGITSKSSLTECDEFVFDNLFDVNVKATFFCTQQATRHMLTSGGGSIVLVSSAHAWRGEKNRAAYAITKGALLTLSQHIAKNYASNHIRCNVVTMGWTPTEGELSLRQQEGLTEKNLKEKASKILPMGRMLTPEDHLSAFIYFLSEDSAMVTGSNILVTAGEFI
jgi:NAD(P)-dependent dehydrogenase (short-subunit alcohol dehydrogenase family)